MQIILTEEEYNQLKSQAKLHQYDSTEIQLLNEELEQLTSKYKELESKYNKLLVFGVSTSAERLKSKANHGHN